MSWGRTCVRDSLTLWCSCCNKPGDYFFIVFYFTDVDISLKRRWCFLKSKPTALSLLSVQGWLLMAHFASPASPFLSQPNTFIFDGFASGIHPSCSGMCERLAAGDFHPWQLFPPHCASQISSFSTSGWYYDLKLQLYGPESLLHLHQRWFSKLHSTQCSSVSKQNWDPLKELTQNELKDLTCLITQLHT